MNKTYLLIVFTFFYNVLCVGQEKEPHHEHANIKFETLVKSTKSWDGQLLPKYPEGQPEVTVARVVIPPHTKLPLHFHPVINAGVLIRGEVIVVSNEGKEKHLKAGDSLIELVNKYHYGENKLDTPAEFIIVYAGVKGTPITVKSN